MVGGLTASLVGWWFATASFLVRGVGADVVGQIDASASGPGLRTLVVVDGPGGVGRGAYSLFLDDLERNGHVVKVAGASDPGTVLESYGEALYDTVVFFAPRSSLPAGEDQSGRGRLSVLSLLSFVDGGGNLVVAAGGDDGTVVQSTRDVVKEVANGALVAEDGALVVDHGGKSVVRGSRDHADVVARASATSSARAVLGEGPLAAGAPVVVRGAAMLGVVAPLEESRGTDQEVAASEVQLLSLLEVPASAYSFRPYSSVGQGDVEVSTGARDIEVALAVQTRANSRVVVLAGADVCSDRLYSVSVEGEGATGNRAFCARLAAWTSKQVNYVRPMAVRHHREGEAVAPAMYRIKEPVVYEVDLAQWDAGAGAWVPYAADDVQVEFRMLHPYWRLTLDDLGNGTFRTSFTTPDKYGVFKFSIRYNRPGYSRVHVEHEAPTRPFRHDEYERFIVTAYPYYASIASMGVGFVVLGLAYLYTPLDAVPKGAGAADAAGAAFSGKGKGKAKTS